MAGSMARGLLVLVAVVAGGLVGLAAGPAAWSVLEGIGVVAWPVCNDVFVDTVNAMCARPRSMEMVALATTVLAAVLSGVATWRTLLVTAGAPDGPDSTD